MCGLSDGESDIHAPSSLTASSIGNSIFNKATDKIFNSLRLPTSQAKVRLREINSKSVNFTLRALCVAGGRLWGMVDDKILWFGVTAHPTAEWNANQVTEACGWEKLPPI